MHTRIKRRHFLQFAGATLASLGLSQTDILHQADRYGQVLAQGRPGRKLALLVGINKYPSEIPSLQGSLTDLELQWELLVHRYGFKPEDIFIVADHKLSVADREPLKPTRQNILEAFENHLIQQAKPDDVVIFHYSGHGSRILDPNPLPELLKNENGQLKRVPNTDQINGTMVPYDRLTDNPDQVQDITGRSLFLLSSALQTDKVTVILDSCHSGGGTRGNQVFRAVPSRLGSDDFADPSPIELDFQQRWIRDLQFSEFDLQERRQRGIAKGVAIGSAQYDQMAVEAPFDNDSFRAGAFTYVLTRYLWQQSKDEAIGRIFVDLGRSARDIAKQSSIPQEPILAANPESNVNQPAYFLPAARPFADAVVRTIEADVIRYWLGGISSVSLEANQAGTIFSVIDNNGTEVAQIEQIERQKLVGMGKLKSGSINAIQPGALLREQIRGLPTDLKLRVGLDPSLGSDLQAARTALQSLNRIEVVASEQAMDFRFGRMTSDYQAQLEPQTQTLPSLNSLGLFTAGLEPLTATFNQPNETLSDAISRLKPRLQSLLAAAILKAMGGVDIATANQTTNLEVNIVPTGTTGGRVRANQFQPGTEIQIKVKNKGQDDLFVAVVSIGSAGNLRVLFPYFDAADDRARVSSQQELTVPEAGVVFPLSQTPGAVEIMVLSSTRPISDALQALKTIATRGGVSSTRGISSSPMGGEDALEVMGALLGNLDQNTRSDIEAKAEIRAVDTTQFSLVSTLIEVVGN
jgi:hypothetical protein